MSDTRKGTDHIELTVKDLIGAVLKDPVAVLHGTSSAGDEIISIGPPALPFIQAVLDGQYTSEAHPVDVIEAFMILGQRINDRA